MKYRFGYLLLVAALFSSCNKESVELPAVPYEIKINAFIEEGSQVCPISTKVVGGDLANGYILYGALTKGLFLNPTAQSAATYFVKERKMNADGTTVDATKLYWKADGATYHSFFAHSANPAGVTSGRGVTSVDYTYYSQVAYGINLRFTQEDDPAKQIDLLVADRMDIQTTEGVPSAVNLYFHHRLSKVSIRIFGSGGVNLNDCQAKITYNSAGPLKRKAGVDGSYQAGSVGLFISRKSDGSFADYVKPNDKHSGTYNLGGTFSVPGSAVAEKDAILVGDMILMPNQYPTSEWATLTISYKPDDSSTPIVVSAPLPALSLLPTMQTVVTFNILEATQSLSVSRVTLTDWVTTSGTIDQL